MPPLGTRTRLLQDRSRGAFRTAGPPLVMFSSQVRDNTRRDGSLRSHQGTLERGQDSSR